jgi:hypothetical protein
MNMTCATHHMHELSPDRIDLHSFSHKCRGLGNYLTAYAIRGRHAASPADLQVHGLDSCP